MSALSVRSRGRVLFVALIFVVLVAMPAPRAFAAGACRPSEQITGVPVVVVHGWGSSAAAMAGTAQALEKALPNDRYTITRFDYAERSISWPEGDTASCLAAYLVAAWKSTNKSHKVVVVAHSMGGIATRFASELSVKGVAVSQVLATLVTLGTPHQGSPWGGTLASQGVQSIRSLWTSGALPGTSGTAATCLAPISQRSSRCATPPYLPKGVAVEQIGTQITVKRTLFNLGFLKREALISLFGDGIVPQGSANGYLGSVSGARPPRAEVSLKTIGCEYSTDYLLSAKLGAKLGSRAGPAGSIIGGEIGILSNIFLDRRALDDILAGRASPALAELTLHAMGTPCFHTNLTTESRVIAAAAAAVERADTRVADVPAADPLAAIAGGWSRHSTDLQIELDGTGTYLERTYTPCGSTSDCTFKAELAFERVEGTVAPTLIATYTRVWYEDWTNTVVNLRPEQLAQIDPFFPRAGERARVTLNEVGQLRFEHLGHLNGLAGGRDTDANTYCSDRTQEEARAPCGA